MNKRNFLFLSLFVFSCIFIFACDWTAEKNTGDVKYTDDYYISFKIDGVEKFFPRGDIDYRDHAYGVVYTDYDHEDVWMLAENPKMEHNYIELQFGNIELREYSTGTYDLTIYYGENVDLDYSDESMVATLTSVGGLNEPIEGTFSGTMSDWDNPDARYEITDGVFRVLRILDPGDDE